MLPPSGEQFALVHGAMSAVITEVGATLRCFRVGSEPVVWEFSPDEIDSGGRGQVLAPWPNRLEGGSFRFGGIAGKAPLDEPERGNAIHGLVRWGPWTFEGRTAERVALSYLLHPQPAYPFRVRIELDYELGADGLAVTCAATNAGSEPAPFGVGFHPYLLAGPGGVDRAGMKLEARRRLVLDERGLPVGDEPVSGTAYELDGRALSGLALDDCYTGLALGPDGRWHACLEAPGRRSELWADAAFRYAMCYTGDSLSEVSDRRKAIAVEPMTCPPNALRTGTDLIELRPGERWQASWGIAVVSD
ncbi:MAG: aldose 1-epimerase family protein [Acidimicrobiales bacterium]